MGDDAPSVHDNWLYAHVVDHERGRVVLHTVYPHVEPNEFTDVVFTGVFVHHFEQAGHWRDPDVPANVLFGVEEENPRFVLGNYGDLVSRTRKYGWPAYLRYENLDDLVEQLTADGVTCFHIRGTVGLDGFVFARSMQLVRRTSRAVVDTG